MRSAHSAKGGIIIATLAAGPLFVAGLAIGAWLTDPAKVLDPNTLPAARVLFLLPFAMIFGALPAVAPTVLGATLLHWLGERNIAMRLPVVWVIVGALASGSAIVAFGGDPATIVAFPFTGGSCALICRWRAGWD